MSRVLNSSYSLSAIASKIHHEICVSKALMPAKKLDVERVEMSELEHAEKLSSTNELPIIVDYDIRAAVPTLTYPLWSLTRVIFRWT